MLCVAYAPGGVWSTLERLVWRFIWGVSVLPCSKAPAPCRNWQIRQAAHHWADAREISDDSCASYRACYSGGWTRRIRRCGVELHSKESDWCTRCWDSWASSTNQFEVFKLETFAGDLHLAMTIKRSLGKMSFFMFLQTKISLQNNKLFDFHAWIFFLTFVTLSWQS